MGRGDRRSRGHKRGRYEPEELDDESGVPEGRSQTREEITNDQDAWRRDFVKRYKPRRERRKEEFDYDNPKVTTEDGA